MVGRDFLSMPAPENYVAGLGRGATGFTTRSDLGPAREGPSEEQMKEMLAKRAAQLGQAAPSAYGVEKKDDDEEEDRFQDPDNEVGLFSSGINHNEDDDEADRIYQEVDEKMDKRRRIRREAREKAEREEYERNNPKIQQQFAEYKRALAAVSEEEWAALPEVGDMTGKNKRAREARQANQRFYAVPDSVLQGAAAAGQLETSISTDSGDGTMTNFASIGAAQQSALQVRLDAASSGAATSTTTNGTSTVSGTSTSVDPRGYITALDKATSLQAGAPIEDINRARVLLESAVKTNLHNGPAHVALCRLEEVAGKIHTAKKVISRGCELCPHSIVCWEENIRINRGNKHNAKIIAAQAIKLNPKAITLWKAAIELEQTPAARKKVTRQALDHNPQSIELWKILINDTEDVENVRLLFAKAVETIPLSEELWISYARISDADSAQQILNAARKALPTSWAIWVQACRLQEQLGKTEPLPKIMERAVKALIKANAMLKREEWISQAEKCEEEGAVATCAAIISATIGWGLDEDDERKDKWLQDAKASINRGKYVTARAIITHCLRVFPTSKTTWHAAADLEKRFGTTEELLKTLGRATNACPKCESLWLMFANEAWHSGDKDEARKVLGAAFDQLPDNENIYLRAVQLEIEAKEYESARNFLAMGRSSSPTDRLYIKSAVLERQLGNLDAALDYVNQGIQTWPASWKLHAIKGQIYESMGKLREAQEAFSIGTRANSKAVPLFLLLSRIQEKQGAIVKARSTLDRARNQNPKNPELLCEAIRLERRAGNMAAAQQLMAVALQQCPSSGLLWSEKIMHMEARTQRKPRALEAIKKVENNPLLFVTVARIFWAERRLDKAVTWFTKAIVLDADYGDGWAWYYKFLEQHGTEEKKQEVLSKVVTSEPKHGEVWQTVAKDPKNADKSYEEILKIVVTKLE
ncbi:hypothetical protein GQ43DRAFT_390718 [Delitschia confertaspora ATCC 74209]|uniref:PRP1 splicing factor N-terminal domain-containing protein n=1 Tax=Delitschia confertaspora ATCC 74209 TaxID=1513339 RepID=A0A9P4JPE1_9PLEO|nr:hypothetical protein GQ43DRAFT_390718 [Delitschia confertaspora ATCC 74209]